MSIYMTYFKAIGLKIVLCFFLMLVIGTIVGFWSKIWLAKISDQVKANNGTESSWIYESLGIYTVLGVSQSNFVQFFESRKKLFLALFVVLATIFMAFGMVYASSTIHKIMLKSVLKSPMSFFDATPMGRILNRFSKVKYFLKSYKK